MAYFRCGQGSGGGGGSTFTIEIETDSPSLYGQSITISKSGTTVGITVFDNTGHAEYVVDEPGTYRASCTYSGVTFYDEVTFSTVETAMIYATPQGSTVTPTDVVNTLLKCANIWDKNYTTISQLLSDTSALLTVISTSNSVDYLVRSTTWAADVCADSTAMTYIGANNYCADKLLSDSTWLHQICTSTYMESVLNSKVPTMTSATAPSGEVFASNYITDAQPYKAFDGLNSTEWNGSSTSGTSTATESIGYDFGYPVNVKFVRVLSRSANNWTSGIIDVGDDGTTWNSVATFSGDHTGANYETLYHLFTAEIPENNLKKDRVRFTSTSYRVGGTGSGYGEPALAELQFYCRKDV